MTKMKTRTIHPVAAALMLLIVSCLSSPATGGDLPGRLVGSRGADCVGTWCYDDYCPKQQPGVGVHVSRSCDDYYPKKCPCVYVHLGRRCDDYSPKCCPPACLSRPSDLKCNAAANCTQ